jgi:hypothetical protein
LGRLRRPLGERALYLCLCGSREGTLTENPLYSHIFIRDLEPSCLFILNIQTHCANFVMIMMIYFFAGI